MYNTAYNTSLRILAVTAWVIAAASPATAQGAAPPAKPEMTQSCPGLIATRPPFVEPATLRLAALERDQVRISYVGHATFLIESPQLVRIATDYNDYVRPSMLPDIVTMNHAHSSHFSLSPDAGIKYVLHGWADDEKPARVDLQYKDVRVRNVPTNIRTFEGTAIRFSFSR